MFFKKLSKDKKQFLEGYILFEVGNYALMGLYSKNVLDSKKRKLHYLPYQIVKFI